MSKEILIEAAQTANVERDGKNLFIHGLALLSNQKDRNNRIYSEEVNDNAVQHLQEKLKSGATLFGTLGHSQDMTVPPNQIATVVKSLTKSKDGWVARSQVIDKGAGSVLGSIIRAGGKLGHSVKGTGSVKRNKQTQLDEVQDDFRIHSIDIVESPSIGHAGLFNAIYEEVASQATLTSRTLDKSDLDSKVRSIIRGLGRADLHVDFDATYGLFQSPHDDKTYLQNLEALRADILAKLADVQAKIVAQNDGDYSNFKDVCAQYIKKIAGESSALKRSFMKREMVQHVYGQRLIESTIKLLSRGGSRLSTLNETVPEIETIRRRSGTKISDNSKEMEAISQWHKEQENERRDLQRLEQLKSRRKR
jgi:hypothetical protein